MWNRIRYTFWAPAYDAIVRAAGVDDARRRSIARLQLRAGDRVLIVGAGTGLDLPHLPADVHVTAIDCTPAMLTRLRRRAQESGRRLEAHVMDARQLPFADAAFDAVIMHLVLAVMPEPEKGLAEAERVLKPGGRIAVFDKFLREGETPSLKRRLINVLAKPLFSDVNRRLSTIRAGRSLIVEQDEPVAFGGAYRVITLRKPDGGD